MTSWQRRARLVIALGAVLFAIVVAFAVKRRPPVVARNPEAQTDPTAVVQSTSGRHIDWNREHENYRIDYEKLLTYADGSSKMLGVTVTTERAGGRIFVIKAKEGQA